MKQILALAFLFAAGSTSAQTFHEGDDILLGGCLPPEEPYQFELPDDPELRQMINEDYQTFILEAEDYMNCLQAEQQRTFNKINAILQRYIAYFGDDAALQSMVE